MIRRGPYRCIVGCVVLLAIACSEQATPIVPAPPPSSPLASAPFVAAPAPSVVSSEQDVYVSLPPDSIPSGVTATIINRRTGASVTAAIAGGGFDPVILAGLTGDTLTIAVQTTASPLSFTFTVPSAVPPVVVRTDPLQDTRHVPLNASLVIVFNQPIDPTTLTGSNVQLLDGTSVVPGAMNFADAQHVIATFQPTAPLAANAAYRIAVGIGIRDTHGAPLTAPVSVTYTTGQGTTTNASRHLGDGVAGRSDPRVRRQPLRSRPPRKTAPATSSPGGHFPGRRARRA